MKKTVIINSIVFLFVLLSFNSPVSGEYVPARLSYVDGDVTLRNMPRERVWTGVSVNMPVIEGDEIRVSRNGRAEIQFPGGVFIRMDGNTDVRILRTGFDQGGNSYRVRLISGRVFISYNDLPGKKTVLRVYSGNVSTLFKTRAQASIEFSGAEGTGVAVLTGMVIVKRAGDSLLLRSGTRVVSGRYGYPEPVPMRAAGNWIRWNLDRDYLLAEGLEDDMPLPTELKGYYRDFSDYGRWVYTDGYGYVWVPFVDVDWTPYSLGKWVLVREEYVWVSDEPWGWIPYHYGRWIYREELGWCWVLPMRRSVTWSPALVAWIYTPDYVAWVPLAPGEVYYRPYRVSVVKDVKITNLYINGRVKNSVKFIYKKRVGRDRWKRIIGREERRFIPVVQAARVNRAVYKGMSAIEINKRWKRDRSFTDGGRGRPRYAGKSREISRWHVQRDIKRAFDAVREIRHKDLRKSSTRGRINQSRKSRSPRRMVELREDNKHRGMEGFFRDVKNRGFRKKAGELRSGRGAADNRMKERSIITFRGDKGGHHVPYLVRGYR